jgi:hypothetical protein
MMSDCCGIVDLRVGRDEVLGQNHLEVRVICPTDGNIILHVFVGLLSNMDPDNLSDLSPTAGPLPDSLRHITSCRHGYFGLLANLWLLAVLAAIVKQGRQGSSAWTTVTYIVWAHVGKQPHERT